MAFLVGVGEGLGKFLQSDGEFHWGVQSARKRILLSEAQYKVWQVAKMAAYPVEEFTKLLDLRVNDIRTHLKSLQEEGIVIYSTDLTSSTFLSTYVGIPKGYLVSQEKDEWKIAEFRNAPPLSLPLITVTIWRLANPHLPLETLVTNLTQVLDLPREEVVKVVADALPFLIGNGLLTLDRSLSV